MSTKNKENECQRIGWLLTTKLKQTKKSYQQPYGDLGEINTSRLILNSVGKNILTNIVNDYLDLLGTSAAVYEKNGDYALGIFSSGWCRYLDSASRRLCKTKDNKKALASGKWHCHESCWKETSRKSMKKGRPVDIECKGGVRLYAVPIRAGKKIIGAINFGYSDPPKDTKTLKKIAKRYKVSLKELTKQANSYESRPPFIVGMAKRRLFTAAKLIGEIVKRKTAENALDETLIDLKQRVKELNCLYEFSKIIEYPKNSIDKILLKTVNLVNSAWRYPEAACVRIILGAKEYTTKNCRPTPWKITAPIKVENDKVGFIGSCYQKMGKIKEGEKTFLKEEKNLLDVMAKRLSEVLENEKRRKKTEEAIRIKSDFVSMVSHELRTPLTVIKECINIVSEEAAKKISKEEKTFLNMAKNNTSRLARLINNVLDFQKFETNEVKLELKKGYINEVVDEVRETMVSLIQEKGLKLNIKFDRNLPQVKFNKDKIVQVLTNLIDNAISFTNKGNITISVCLLGKAVCVSVKDTGLGIRKKDLPKLFRKFKQLGMNSERKTGGVGLGLAISKEIIESHGGKIWARSKFGKGAMFKFTLPIKR